MNARQLKQIALITMLIDHIGALLLPQWTFLRMIGRISFPLFAFLAAQSVLHTHSAARYMGRLFVFACVAELPFRFTLLHGEHAFGLRNVLFTLLLGALACVCWARADAHGAHWQLIACAPLAAAAFLQTDYGAYGAATVLLFFALRDRSKIQLYAAFACLTALYCATVFNLMQFFALLALPFLQCYNGQKGSGRGKYAFYLFYPVHLLVLWGISQL